MRRDEVGRVLAGVAAGAVIGWLWRAAGERTRAGAAELGTAVDEGWSDRWGDRMDAAVDAAAQSIRSVSARWRERPPLDEGAARARLAAVEGTSGVRLRVLGAGILEVSGEASEAPAGEAVRQLRALPGVRAVVNRIWTPSSADPGRVSPFRAN